MIRTSRYALFASALHVSFLVAACGESPVATPPDASFESAEGAITLKASSGNLDVAIGSVGSWTDVGGETLLVFEGRASRELTEVFSFVPDDAFGLAWLRGCVPGSESPCEPNKRFVVALRAGHEVNSIASGGGLLVRLTPADGSLTHFLRLELRPTLFQFAGSTTLRFDRVMRPVAVSDDEASRLRYRVELTSKTVPESGLVGAVLGAYRPATAITPLLYFVDFQFDELESASRTNGVVLAEGTYKGKLRTKTARARFELVELSMTTDDPYEVFPPTSCSPGTYECIPLSSNDPMGLGLCGDYLDVRACLSAQACAVYPAAPLSLSSRDPAGFPGLAAGADEFIAGCGQGGSWCQLNSLQVFDAPPCLDEPATLVALAGAAASLDQSLAGLQDYGVDVPSGALANLAAFGYSLGGAALLSAMNAAGGGEPSGAYLYEDEVPCHNCHEFQATLLVWYGATSRLVVLKVTRGYDS